MQNNILIYFDIITSLKTKDDLDQLASQVDTLLASIFETKNQSFDNALRSVSLETTKKIKEALAKNGMDIENKEVIRNFLLGLKKLLGKFKTIRLIIAFELSEKVIENIHNWVSSNLGEGYILDIETNQSLIGGAIIVSPNGQYRDLTVKKNLEDVFSANKEEILTQMSA